MMKKNKGQINHAFTMIFFILVAGFVFFLGYTAINGFVGQSCEAQKTGLKADLIRFFEIYDDFGSVHKEGFTLPCNYEYVCFVDNSVYDDPDNNIGSIPIADINGRYDVIKTAEVETVNIFLVGEFAEPLGYSEKVEVGELDKILCVSSPVNLVFEGHGMATKVSEDS